MKETALTKVEESIFSKIKRFFKNLFKKKVTVEYNINEDFGVNNKINFKQSIEIKEDKEKTRLLKLQSEFANGDISENEIEEEDVEKLHELYDEQIDEINQQTEMYKKRILEIKKKLNKTA